MDPTIFLTRVVIWHHGTLFSVETREKWLFNVHGKNACDSNGGVVKHNASLHKLRSPPSGAVQTSIDLVGKLQSRLPNVILLHVSRKEAEVLRETKENANEWALVQPVPRLHSSYT